VRMRRVGTKGGTAGIPSEMVQFVHAVSQVELTNNLPI
jgi:hypothetical protein